MPELMLIIKYRNVQKEREYLIICYDWRFLFFLMVRGRTKMPYDRCFYDADMYEEISRSANEASTVWRKTALPVYSLILYVNLSGLRDAQIDGKHYFWVCVCV